MFCGPGNFTVGWCGSETENNRRETLPIGTYASKPVLMHTNVTGPTQDTPSSLLSVPRSLSLHLPPKKHLYPSNKKPRAASRQSDASKNLQSLACRLKSERKSLMFSGPGNLTAGWCGPGTQNNRRETLPVGTHVPKLVLMHANMTGSTQNTPTWSERRRDCHKRCSDGMGRK
jgi:hypothetical protein